MIWVEDTIVKLWPQNSFNFRAADIIKHPQDIKIWDTGHNDESDTLCQKKMYTVRFDV